MECRNASSPGYRIFESTGSYKAKSTVACCTLHLVFSNCRPKSNQGNQHVCKPQAFCWVHTYLHVLPMRVCLIPPPPDIDSCSPRNSICVLNLKNKENFASLYVCIFRNIGANWENGNWRLSQSTFVLLLLFGFICLRQGLIVLPSRPGTYTWTKLDLSLGHLSWLYLLSTKMTLV